MARNRRLSRAAILLTWAGATVAYALFVILRWAHRGQAPGLSSATAIGAITASWLYLLLWHLQDSGITPSAVVIRLSVLLLAVLAGTMITNVVVVVRRLHTEGSLPIIPAAATFSFGYVMRHVLHEVRGDEKPERRS